jgi:hypothetical protein
VTGTDLRGAVEDMKVTVPELTVPDGLVTVADRATV